MRLRASIEQIPYRGGPYSRVTYATAKVSRAPIGGTVGMSSVAV